MSRKIDPRIGVLSLIVFVTALSRLLPHPPNFTPVGALGLFGAAYFSRKYLAFLLPFLALWVSDLFLNNLVYARLYPEFYNGFSWFGNAWTYLSFGLIIGLGMIILKKVKLMNLLGAALGASVIFLLLTNFGSWIDNPVYPQTPQGLIASYTMGLPFFWNTLLGNLFFSLVLFGAFEWAGSRYPVLKRERT